MPRENLILFSHTMERVTTQREVLLKKTEARPEPTRYEKDLVYDADLVRILNNEQRVDPDAPRSLNELDQATSRNVTEGSSTKYSRKDIYANYPAYSLENPPAKLWAISRLGFFLASVIPGILAGAAWTFDAMLHLMGMPHSVLVHAPAGAITVPAVTLLNLAWRGYSVSGKGLWGSLRETWRSVFSHSNPPHPYDGNGYPVSGTTYAKESTRGRYNDGILMRGVSAFVYYILAPIAHVAEGVRDAAFEEDERMWAMPGRAWWPVGDVSRALASYLRSAWVGITRGTKEGWSNYRRDANATGR